MSIIEECTYELLRSNNHRSYEHQLPTTLVLQAEKLTNNVSEVHVREIVVHQGRIGHKVLELEFEQFGSGLLLVEEVQRVDLLEHLVLDHLAPYAFHLIAPIRADSSDLEQLPAREQAEDILLHHTTRHALDPHSV